MKRTLRVLPNAEAELQPAAIWYEEKRRGLGIEFVAVVDRAFQSVLENRRWDTSPSQPRPKLVA